MQTDLHTHTVASDGLLTVSGLIDEARKTGLQVLAITDHDTLDSLEEGQSLAARHRIRFVPGIELNAETEECEVHILGYFIPTTCPILEDFLADIRQKRDVRTTQIIDKLATLDVQITYRRVRELAKGKTLGRPHIAMAMVEKGYAASIQDAFNRYLGKGAPGHVPRYRFEPVSAVQMIRRAGGLPVLAHPSFITSVEGILPSLLAEGLGGIEVYYPDHTPLQVQYFKDLAARHGLVVTGGSDFHGPAYREGCHLGGMSMTAEEVEALFSAGITKGAC